MGVRRKGTRKQELEEKADYVAKKLRIPLVNFAENDTYAVRLLKSFTAKGYELSITSKTLDSGKTKWGFVAIGSDLYNTVSYSEIFSEGLLEEIYRFYKEIEKVNSI